MGDIMRLTLNSLGALKDKLIISVDTKFFIILQPFCKMSQTQ